MRKALIGYTGFVGTTLLGQTEFNDCYNSKNIESIKGKTYDLVICAGAPAVKWIANQNPVEDWTNLQLLMSCLEAVHTTKIILVSTVDVYKTPLQVNEETVIHPDTMEPYGKHRLLLERFIQEKFINHTIVRLPGLFGKGIKKNFIFDMIHNNCLHLTHNESVFQFYDLSRLWSDLETLMDHPLPIVNFATEPVSAAEVALICFDSIFTNETDKPSVSYDMQSSYTRLFGQAGPYMLSKAEVFSQIRDFVNMERTNV